MYTPGEPTTVHSIHPDVEGMIVRETAPAVPHPTAATVLSRTSPASVVIHPTTLSHAVAGALGDGDAETLALGDTDADGLTLALADAEGL